MKNNQQKKNSVKKTAAAKSAIWYTVATFLTKGLGFITIPIFTRMMTTGEFGLFNNFAAWQSILLSVFSLEGYASLNRARLDFNGRELQNYQFTLLTCSLSISFLLIVLLLIAPNIPEAFTDLDKKYLYIMVLYLMFYPAFNMFQMFQRVRYRYKLSAALSFGTSLFATLLSVALVLGLSDALLGRIMGQYVPFVVLGVLLYLWYWKTGGKFRLSHLKYAIPLCIPLVIATLGSQVLLLGCRIVTQHSCGPDEVAYLSLATTVANIALILINALNNAWSPWYYDCLESKEYQRVTKTFLLYIWGISLLIIAVIMLGPELVSILGGGDYIPTIWLIPSFMATRLFSMIANQYIFMETYHKDVRAGGLATIVVGFINLPICFVFIALFGFESVGYANMLSYIVLVLIHKIIVRKFDSPDIFSFKVIFPPSLLVLIFIPVGLFVSNPSLALVRYAILAVFVIGCVGILFYQRKQWHY